MKRSVLGAAVAVWSSFALVLPAAAQTGPGQGGPGADVEPPTLSGRLSPAENASFGIIAGSRPLGPAVVPGAREDDVSPGGAFLRSLLLPGWGHVATRSPGRGAFYVAAQSSGFWMLWKSVTRRSTARAAADLERDLVRARLQAQGVTDPVELFTRTESDPAVEEWEALIETRDQQVEDWAAMSIFLVLLGAADAYVTAHLRDFPEPLSIRTRPVGGSGGIEVGLRWAVGRGDGRAP